MARRKPPGGMEATNAWIEFAIHEPMAAEPGTVGAYNSGAVESLADIFQKETGQDIDAYGEKYLFAPLGIRHHWKRTSLGVVDTEGGLFLSSSDLELRASNILNMTGQRRGAAYVSSATWVYHDHEAVGV